MKMKTVLSLLLLMLVGVSSCFEYNIQKEQYRTRKNIDFDWNFKLGDFPGAKNIGYNDSEWRLLDLPHDWSIEGEYDENNEAGIRGAYLPCGIGWYRKSLEWDKAWEGKKVFIQFDGVYMNSEVWINGTHLGKRPYGYIGFAYDLTPYLKKGNNVIAVRVDNSKVPSSRWYTGSGIYRHVWLSVTSDVYVPQWGTFVTTPLVNNNSASIDVSTTVKNESGRESRLSLETIIKDKKGNVVGKTASTFKVEDSVEIKHQLTIDNPALWSPETPVMYSIESIVKVNGKITDVYYTPMGIRTIEMSADKGFLLNGKSLKLKGLSNHHDAGPVGAAVPDDVLYRRLKMLKKMGCNALRTAHNPFSPEFYTMCDTLGFLVMDEVFDGWNKAKAKFDYGNYFDEWWQRDLEAFLKRDRNHPSVMMWSIGNEVPQFTPEGQKRLVDFVKQFDNSRPITQGRGYRGRYIDVAGFNGHGEFRGELEKYHKENPNTPIVGTEITHTLQTRGVYRSKTWYRLRDNPAPWEKGKKFSTIESKIFKVDDLTEVEVFPGITPKYQSSFDNSIVRISIREDWKRVEKYDYYMGNFRWTGFDYLGESFGWPARTANFGIIDLAGFPKDHYYLYQSLWHDKPMVHLLPHWTHPGKEGEIIPVVVYTNCESAELFINGHSFGEKKMSDDLQIVWKIPYEPGTLSIVANNGGTMVAKKSYTTAGVPHGLALNIDKDKIKSNRTDVVHVVVDIVDDKGVPVPYANNLVNFELKGPAKLIGVENGDIIDLNPHKVAYRKAFNGKCLAIIQSDGNSGEIIVKANSEGLKSQTINIIVE